MEENLARTMKAEIGVVAERGIIEVTFTKKDGTERVLKGTLKIAFRDRTETIQENEIIIVPKGVEHKPIAEEEVSIMLFEPATTINTGALENKFTRKKLESI